MSDAKVRGRVHMIDETKTFGQRGFRKRMVVLEQENERFTNYIPLEFTHDGCDTVDQLNEGDEVEITYRLTGRKWQRDSNSEVKYFLNAEAIRFQLMGAQSPSATNEQVTADDTKTGNDQLTEAAYDEDDVPF